MVKIVLVFSCYKAKIIELFSEWWVVVLHIEFLTCWDLSSEFVFHSLTNYFNQL